MAVFLNQCLVFNLFDNVFNFVLLTNASFLYSVFIHGISFVNKESLTNIN